jgi:hypothetical protein
VAAVLTSLLFFSFNGCVHSGWIQLEAARAKASMEHQDGGTESGPSSGLDSGAVGFFTGALDVLHFTLPKTSDADVIAAKLRTLVSSESVALRDPPGSLIVHTPPARYALDAAAEPADLARQAARWTWDGGQESKATLSLRRESRLVDKPGDKPRKRSTAECAREIFAGLKDQAGIEAPERSKVQGLRIELEYVAWSSVQDSRKSAHARAFFSSGDWMYVLELQGQAPGAAGAFAQERLRELCESFVIDRDDPRYLEPQAWYTRRLDWTAPLRHNIFFSVGSSLVFALLLFWLAAWKLRRIDF